jgi:hypothetical protein
VLACNVTGTMRMLRKPPIAAFMLLALVVSGCGASATSTSRGASGSPRPSAPAATTPPTTSQSEGTSSTETATQGNPHRRLAFSLVAVEGWTYSGSVSIPDFHAHFASNRSASPPGESQVTVSISGEPFESVSFKDTNPGRPNGPPLGVPEAWFAFELPESLVNESGLEDRGGCRLGGYVEQSISGGSSYPGIEPYEHDLRCGPPSSSATPAEVTLSSPGSEHKVEALVSHLNQTDPVFVVLFDPPGANTASGVHCFVFVTQAGGATRSQLFSRQCGKAQFHVEAAT